MSRHQTLVQQLRAGTRWINATWESSLPKAADITDHLRLSLPGDLPSPGVCSECGNDLSLKSSWDTLANALTLCVACTTCRTRSSTKITDIELAAVDSLDALCDRIAHRAMRTT